MNLENRPKTIGWREWVRLPDLGVGRLKAKIDTGARSSSLHAFDIAISNQNSVDQVRFKIQPSQNDESHVLDVCVPIFEFRKVRSSNGQTTLRPVIRTTIELFKTKYEIDVTLFDRTKMGFRMLIGREALKNRFVVDSSLSYCGGRPKKKFKTRDLPETGASS